MEGLLRGLDALIAEQEAVAPERRAAVAVVLPVEQVEQG